MPLKYNEIDDKLKSIGPVMDDIGEWYGRVVRRLFYADHYEPGHTPPLLESFGHWMDGARQDDFFAEETLRQLENTYADLQKAMDDIAVGAPDITRFDEFTDMYHIFLLQMRRLEHDCMLADFGMDAMSGLRSRKAMYHDLERELERRSRKGKPFSLALAQIDNYDQIITIIDDARLREIMATLGRLILLCVRSFDDAYRSSECEFVMSLKHADTAGGTAAITRLRTLLQAEKIIISGRDADGKTHNFPLTMSYCVAEPLPGDTLDMLMENMRADLGKYSDGADTAMEYVEQSPLQRFVRDLREEKL